MARQEYIIFCYASNKQWGVIFLEAGKGKIVLPISAEFIAVTIQHCGATPQYSGVNDDGDIVSSLSSGIDAVRYIAITK